MTKRFGFTLAEVLVTLTIIGVVASMTAPTLISNTSAQEHSAGLKKAISTLNQAITMQYALDGTDMREYSSIAGQNVFDGPNGAAAMLMNRLQVVSTSTNRKTSSDGHAKENAALYLSDGMVIEFPSAFFASTTCRANQAQAYGENNFTSAGEGECLYSILVDVNGDKGKCTHSEQKSTTDKKGKNARLNPGDCLLIDVYSDGVRPGNWMGERIMYHSGKLEEETTAAD